MRAGIVRTDLGKGVYIADLSAPNQRPFASSNPGQARKIRRPTDAELAAAIAAYPAGAAATGTNTSATVDTSTNNTLRIRTVPGAAYTVIAVTTNATLAKTTIRDEINAALLSAGLLATASIVGTNQLRITTTGANRGPGAFLQIDSVGNGSTLSTAVGFTVGGVTASGVAAATLLANLKSAVYPTATTINVASATVIGANAAFALLSGPDQTAFATRVADLVAPSLIETPDVLRSFAIGAISKLRSASYRPDGDRVGLPTGIAMAVVDDDGSTPFTYP